MEKSTENKHSKIWNKIYSTVKHLPIKKVETDSVDIPSVTTELENLFLDIMIQSYREGFSAATEALVAANIKLQERNADNETKLLK